MLQFTIFEVVEVGYLLLFKLNMFLKLSYKDCSTVLSASFCCSPGHSEFSTTWYLKFVSGIAWCTVTIGNVYSFVFFTSKWGRKPQQWYRLTAYQWTSCQSIDPNQIRRPWHLQGKKATRQIPGYRFFCYPKIVQKRSWPAGESSSRSWPWTGAWRW